MEWPILGMRKYQKYTTPKIRIKMNHVGERRFVAKNNEMPSVALQTARQPYGIILTMRTIKPPMPDTAPKPNALAAARCTTTQDLLYHGPQHAAHTHLHGSLRDLNTVDKSVQLKNYNGFIGTVLSSF